MDKFFDRLGDLLQSLLGGDSARSGGYDPRDPDMREAIEELDAYLESGAPGPGVPGPGAPGPGGSQRRTAGPGGFAAEESGDRGYDRRSREEGHRFEPAFADPALRRDYATLEVAFAAPFADVRRSYKRLLHKYHPDRFSGDAEKQALANEVTQRLNEAFGRIERQNQRPPG
jgi:DnaJ-domain-containing protein 1